MHLRDQYNNTKQKLTDEQAAHAAAKEKLIEARKRNEALTLQNKALTGRLKKSGLA